MSARYPFIDNLKAIGIVLVVLGHAPGMAGTAHTLIFGFHVPLFFFASGFLAGARERDAGGQRASLVRRFVLPYAGFFLLSWLYWLATRDLGNSAARFAALPWWDPLIGFALGYGGYVNPTLWFFPCLAATVLLHGVGRRWLAGLPLLLACVAGAAGMVLLWPGGPALPWRLDAAAVALGFYAIGGFCRERGLDRLAQRPAAALWPWSLALLAAYATLALGNPGVDLAEMNFGATPVLFLPVALLGIAACLLASLCFAGNRVTRWLAANTLAIFPLHWLLYRVFTGMGIVLFGLPRDFKEQSWLIGVGYALLALLLCWPAARLVRRALGSVVIACGGRARANWLPVQGAATLLGSLPSKELQRRNGGQVARALRVVSKRPRYRVALLAKGAGHWRRRAPCIGTVWTQRDPPQAMSTDPNLEEGS